MSYEREYIATQAAQLLEQGFVIVDLETTGFASDPKVEIVEVAVINHLGETLFNSLVKPQRKIPRDASAVNGIYDDDVKDAPPFRDIYPQIVDLLHRKQVAAYNYTFEEGIFGRVCDLYGVDYIEPQLWYCPMRAYQKFSGRRNFVKLTAACGYEKIMVANAHRALGDCLMTLELIKKMAQG